MSDARTPFDKMTAAAQKMVQDINPVMAEISEEDIEALFAQMLKDWMDFSFGNAVNQDGLWAKSRLLPTLAGLIMQGAQNKTLLRLITRNLRETGAHDREIFKTNAIMSIFAGFPAISCAMDAVKVVHALEAKSGGAT